MAKSIEFDNLIILKNDDCLLKKPYVEKRENRKPKVGKVPRILVLLSTYNGERYLREQLDSILNQDKVEVFILVRDDGSSDSTLEILTEYECKGFPLKFYQGSNVGPAASFNNLISHELCEKFDFYAFSDQDDVWLKDKLWNAFTKLSLLDVDEVPCLYCSNLIVTDSSLNPLHLMRKPNIHISHKTLIVQDFSAGCTQLFNRMARESYIRGIDCSMDMHDYWLALTCVFLGQVIFDKTPHILYRQHNDNVIGARKMGIKDAVSSIINKNQNKHSLMLSEFYDINKEYLPMKDSNIIRAIPSMSYSIPARLWLLFSPEFRGYDIKVTIGFKLRVLLNRMY